MTQSYYVYYKTPAEADEVRRVVREVLRLVDEATRVRGRLMRRRDDPTTWMEVYDAVPDAGAFEEALAAALERSEFARIVPPGAQRHTERFVPA